MKTAKLHELKLGDLFNHMSLDCKVDADRKVIGIEPEEMNDSFYWLVVEFLEDWQYKENNKNTGSHKKGDIERLLVNSNSTININYIVF